MTDDDVKQHLATIGEVIALQDTVPDMRDDAALKAYNEQYKAKSQAAIGSLLALVGDIFINMRRAADALESMGKSLSETPTVLFEEATKASDDEDGTSH